MSAVLVAHHSEAALERERIAELVALLRHGGFRVEHTLAATWLTVERAAEAADHILLVDPAHWWSCEPSPKDWALPLRERLEFELANGWQRFAVVQHDEAALACLPAALPRFVLPGAWAALLDHLAPRQPAPAHLRSHGSLPEPRPFVPRPELEQEIEQAIERRPNQLVWIRGRMGAGKSTLLRGWLERASGQATSLHIARPGIAATLRPDALLERLASAPEQPLLLAIDGLEQLLDRTDDLVPKPERQRLAAALAGPLPAGLTVIATSRPLAPGQLDTIEPAIDLDAPAWAAEQRALVDVLLAGREDRATLAELADDNPGAAQALLERDPNPLAEDEVPPRFAVALERAFVRLLQLPVALRRSVMAGLGLLRVAMGPVPERLLAAALGRELPDLLTRHAAEWLWREAGQLSLMHPFAARYLAAELDPRDLGPHAELLAGIERLRRRGPLEPAVERYVGAWEWLHRRSLAGLGNQNLATHNIVLLLRAAREGVLEARLAQALTSAGAEQLQLLEAMYQIVRRHSVALARTPDALPDLLWTELVARGFAPNELESELAWANLRPPIRLQNQLDNVDHCFRLLGGDDSPVVACALSRDGSVAVTLDERSQLRIWELHASSSRVLRLGPAAEACALTPDGAHLLVSQGSAVILIDPHSGAQLAKHERHDTLVTALAISDDGTRVLSGDHEGVVLLWDLPNDAVVELGRHRVQVDHCVVAPDGSFGASSSDEVVFLWSFDAPAVPDLRAELHGSDVVDGLALSKDGKQLISVCFDEAQIWDPETGEQLASHEDLDVCSVGAAVVGNDSELLSDELAEFVVRWRLADGKVVARHYGHPVAMRCIAASADGEWYLTGGDDHVARLWRRSEAPPEPARVVLPINALVPGEEPDTVWVAGVGARLVALSEQRSLLEIPGYAETVACWRDRVYVVSNSRVTVYAANSGAELSHWEPDADWLGTLLSDPERERIVFTGDRQVYVAAAADGEPRSIGEHSEEITATALLPDGRLLAADGGGAIKLWDLDAEALVLEHSLAAKHRLYTLVPAAQGREVAVAGSQGRIDIIALRDAAIERVRSWEGHAGAINSLALRSDERVLASAGFDCTLRLWSFADGRLLASTSTSYPLTQVVFVGDRLVAGDAAGNLLIYAVDWSTIEQ